MVRWVVEEAMPVEGRTVRQVGAWQGRGETGRKGERGGRRRPRILFFFREVWGIFRRERGGWCCGIFR